MFEYISLILGKWSHQLCIEHDGDPCHDRYFFQLPIVDHKVPFSVVLPFGYVPLKGLSFKHKVAAVLESLAYRFGGND